MVLKKGKLMEVPVWGGGELWLVVVGLLQGGRRHGAASVQIVSVQVQQIISVLVQQIRLLALEEKVKKQNGEKFMFYYKFNIYYKNVI